MVDAVRPSFDAMALDSCLTTGGAGRYRAEALSELALQFGQTFGPQQGQHQ